MHNNTNMTTTDNITSMTNMNLNIDSSKIMTSEDIQYIQHNNWIRELKEEYNFRISLIEKKDLVEFKKEWNSKLPPLIKRSSPHILRVSDYNATNK